MKKEEEEALVVAQHSIWALVSSHVLCAGGRALRMECLINS